MRKFVLGLLGLAVSAAIGRADINPGFGSVSDGNVGVKWTYFANVTDEQNAMAGDYFTIYDFGSIIPNSNLQPAGWTFSTSLVGPTPAQTNAPDNPNILNLTWTYTGPTIIGATPAGKNLGPFSVETNTREQKFGFFAAQGTLAIGPNAGSHVGNAGQLVVPVPEPSSVALIFAAGLGFALVGRRRLR